MARQRPKITLSAAISGYLRYVASAHSPATYSDYSRTLAKFLDYHGDLPFHEVSSEHVEAFIYHMRTTPYGKRKDGTPRYRRPKTLLNLHIGLSAMWTWAVERGWAREHIVRAVPKPKVNREPVIPLVAKEVVALIRACTETRPYHNKPLTHNFRYSAERDKAIISLLVETAIRVSELCDLQYKDVTFSRNGGQIFIDLGKGNKSRFVPFSRRCANLLNDYLMLRPDIEADDYLFVNSKINIGLQMTRRNVQQLVQRLGEKVGVKVSPHKLRTTAACMLVQNGMTAWQLQKIMGHADVQTTMRYVQAANIDLETAMKRASPMDNLRL